jgi:hypothetical protein
MAALAGAIRRSVILKSPQENAASVGFDLSPLVIPAKAGIQGDKRGLWPWIPAFAGMTEGKGSI